MEKAGVSKQDESVPVDASSQKISLAGASDNVDQLHRRLGNRQIQLSAIGSSVGTGIFMVIGGALSTGGPIGLLISWSMYASVMGMVNSCVAEMVTFMPVSGGFIRLAGHWVDDAFGFAAGWVFWFYLVLEIPFEITAISVLLKYWRDDIPVAAVCGACIASIALLNVFAVNIYGEAEFWLSIGKVLLCFILYGLTFVTMVGGNPQHDAYGFRYWKNPGPFAEYISTGDLGRFQGFLATLFLGALLMGGPEYLSFIAAEAKRPRTYIKRAYTTVYWRWAFFYLGGALCVGILIPYNDPKLLSILNGASPGSGTAAASPYVIAMQNLGVNGLPHLVSALLVTSAFSAGNGYVFAATRSLYGLALEGRAPSIFKKCLPNGVPIYSLTVVMLLSCLSFLQVSKGSARVFGILINLLTAGTVVNFFVCTTTYLCFYYACKAQGIDRKELPYYGWFQPYFGWMAWTPQALILLTIGYTVFLPGHWSAENFFTYS